MLTQHPDPQAPPKPVMDEYSQFWGLPPPTSEGMDRLTDKQSCSETTAVFFLWTQVAITWPVDRSGGALDA